MDSPQLQQVIQKLRARLAQPGKTVDDGRLSYEGPMGMGSFALDDDIACEEVGAGGVPSEWVTAPGADADRIMLYLHGGGYIIGSPRTHRITCARLSREAGVRVLDVGYRLAPENPFPAPVEDTLAAYRWLLSNGADPAKIVIGGDSAGGGLAVSAMVAMRYLGEPLPAGGICFSPWTDLEMTGKTMDTNAEVDPSVSRERLEGMAKPYLAGKNPRAPLASPMHADLRGLPPLLIMVGSVEVLVDDAKRLADRAEKAGVDVTLEVWPDMPHNWHTYAPMLPEGQQAIERMAEFMKAHMS